MAEKIFTSSPAEDSGCSQLSFDSSEATMAKQVYTSSSAEDVGYDRILFDGEEVAMAEQVHPSSPAEDVGYGQVFAVLLRRKYWVLSSFLGALGVALLLSLYQKPTYRSSMQLLVDQNYRGKTQQGTTNSVQFADSDVQVDYATQLTLMNGSMLIQRVVDRLQPIYPKLKLADVKTSLSVTLVTGKTSEKKVDTKIFEATYEDLSPVKSQKVLQTVQQVYQDYNREQQKTRLSKGLAFINDQVPQIQEQLKQAESALEKFRKAKNFLNPELQSKALVESLDNILKEQRTNLVQIQDLRTRYAVLEKKLALSPLAIPLATRLSQSLRYQNLLNEIQKTELALVQERLRFTDRSTSVTKLLEQRRQQQSQLLVEMQRISPNGAAATNSTDSAAVMTAGQLGTSELTLASQFTDVQANLSAALARQQSLTRIEKQYKQEIQQFPALLSEYNRLQPSVQVSRDTLQQLLKARQDLGLEIARGGFDWQVVEEPKLGKKTGPVLKRNLLLGAVVGLFLGGIAAFLREAMDDSIHSLDELKKQTSLPSLGAVPKMLLPGSRESGISLPFRYVSTLTPSTPQVNWSPLRESIDLVYKNIQLLESSKVLKSLVVTSVLSGEGKSTLAIGLAMSAARLHKRVLLIDADLRHPSLHEKLDLFNGEGLSTLLSSETRISTDRAIQSLSMNSTLDVLTAGPIHLDPAKLLSSRRMAELMVEFEANYDLVLIDAPPILGLVDTVIVASFCRGVILVERIGRVNRKDLIQAAAIMKRLNVVGLVTNGVDG
jgi:polysaccharide biosynthesis transport protein